MSQSKETIKIARVSEPNVGLHKNVAHFWVHSTTPFDTFNEVSITKHLTLVTESALSFISQLKKLGYEVLYYDTDNLYVKVNTEKEATSLLSKLTNPDGIILVLSRYFVFIEFIHNKRYQGLVKQTGKRPKYISVGGNPVGTLQYRDEKHNFLLKIKNFGEQK
jgi:hypothetical protein